MHFNGAEFASSGQKLPILGRNAHCTHINRDTLKPLGKTMGFLAGKRHLIVGIASDRSIATGIAEAMHREGAELASPTRMTSCKAVWESRRTLRQQHRTVLSCDVTDDTQIDAAFEGLAAKWDGLDGIIHAVGFAPGNELDGNFVDVATREGFKIAHDISSYSFVALAKAGRKMMAGHNAALLTLSYHLTARPCLTTTSWAWPKPAWKRLSVFWPPAWGRKVSV